VIISNHPLKSGNHLNENIEMRRQLPSMSLAAQRKWRISGAASKGSVKWRRRNQRRGGGKRNRKAMASMASASAKISVINGVNGSRRRNGEK
jgi:hypothetical protein